MKLLKRCIAALALSSITFTAPGPMWAGGVQVSANLKRETYLEDIDAQKDAMRRPNVLFLIEATAAMASTPRGVIPQVWRDDRWDDSYWESGDWTQTKRKLGITIYDVNRMMKDFTFGMGALPAAWRGLDIRPERNLYGRDLDDRNNFKRGMNLEMEIELNKDNYYFPFLEEDNALTGLYSGQTIPLEVGFKNAPELWPDRVTYGKFRPLTDVCSVSHPKEDWVSGAKLKIGYTSSIPEINQSTGAVKWTDNVNWYNPSKKKLDAARMRFEGDEQVAYYDYRGLSSAKKPYPYALVFKDPKYWATGWTEGRAPDDDDLVPNDSRMYQTKLVLWNLLQDKELFKNIRFGMATTFLSPANVEIGTYAHTHSGYAHPRQDINGIFKVYPFASNLKTKSYFDINGNAYPSSEQEKDFIDSHSGSYEAQQVPPGYRRVRYENGAMYGPTTGEIEAFFTIHGQYYPIWHNATVHANYATKNADGSEPAGWTKDRNDGELSDRPMYKLMNRASLHLPIMEPDHKWEKGGKTITHIDKFRMWINGIADIKSAGTSRTESASDKSTNRKALVEPARNSQFHYYNDPEIGVAGVFALPQAIFPDPTPRHPYTGQELNLSREYYLSRGWVWYSMKDFNINYRADFRRHSDEIQSTGIPRARYNAGSGEAAGSVLDFFSPPINYNI
ncbi:MAG: hypothetical protein LBS35_05660, partial [Synergistaceae bacterium]|nr:hypothetical protein [Synergistaceae bacterium]